MYKPQATPIIIMIVAPYLEALPYKPANNME